jgi:hypothetical protein
MAVQPIPLGRTFDYPFRPRSLDRCGKKAGKTARCPNESFLRDTP